MSLSIGMDVAVSGLSVTAEQTSIVSRNISRAGDPHASRKIANVVSAYGGVRIASITRAADKALLEKMLAATTAASAQAAIAKALEALDQTNGDPELDASPAAQLAKFGSTLQQFAQAPQDPILARTAVTAARDLANTLNAATDIVQQVRAQADADIASSVSRVNDLLAKFEAVNNRIKLGTASNMDVTDDLDERDRLLASISEEIGIRTVTRGENDMVIFTDNGVTLFDTRPRAVTFSPTQAYIPATTGAAVFVDGVAVTGSTGMMGTASGRIAALTQVRDSIAVTYQSQLDEIARGLISTFAESDQSATPTLPDVPGLFTWAGAPALPPASLQTGIAGSIKIAASVDPAQGGNANLLRDGAISGNPAYRYNATGAAGFSDRLNGLLNSLDAQRAFDPSAAAGVSGTLSNFASSSVAWLQAERKAATEASDYKTTLANRASEALSSATGVNLDDEMTLLLELERSYQASSKLIGTIDNMFGAVLAMVG
ncbi:MAG: flagellar hook-associated protein FlgK [Hyphomicrobiaceae bacterium]